MFKVMIKAVYLNFWNNVPVMKRLPYLEPAKFKRFFWNPIRISGKTIDPLQIWNDKMYGTVDTPVYSEVPNNEKWSSFYHFPVVSWRISFVNARCSTDRESPSWSLAALMVLMNSRITPNSKPLLRRNPSQSIYQTGCVFQCLIYFYLKQ